MKENQDFIFVQKADINEGLTTMTVTKAYMFFTKRFMFVIPRSDVQILGNDSKFKDADAFKEQMLSKASEMPVEQFEAEMFAHLPEDRIFAIDGMDLFKIKAGFFGGMSFRKRGGQRKVANLPRAKRKELKGFYNQI